jgi:glutaminyl-tRNA synthetase
MRIGYFCTDPDSTKDTAEAPARLVFNRTIALRDTWAKIQTQS